MTQATHPRTHARGTRPGSQSVLAIVYAPCEDRASWIENELFSAGVVIQVGRTIPKLVAALTEDNGHRRPQMLVIDLDGVSAGELMHLHVIREQGWFGSIIALGSVPRELCTSLQIDQVIDEPLAQFGSLRDAIAQHRAELHARTMQMPRFF